MLQAALKKYWGYESFRPLQAESMKCVLEDRDSLVVLPTGGGKSLCYQVPAICRDGIAVVVSPLIALMKDQVDGLKTSGVPAAFINSTQSAREQREIVQEIEHNRLRLLYISPERLVQEKTVTFLHNCNLSFIAIDEAHCISEWGHDFRQDYRKLNLLREQFPKIGLHAFTATATNQVRADIARQLQLRDPEVLIGSFHRSNLIYRTERKDNTLAQIREIMDRHPRESGIIYCGSRKDTESISEQLNALNYRTLPYHAGMDDGARSRHQEAFIGESVETIVATIAFGMGIDKSNVRYVIHVGMPKSLESYQQESGRGGRDGLQAECCLLYSAGEYVRWKKMIEEATEGNKVASMKSLQAMSQYCSGVVCRHRQLVEYFSQEFDKPNCGACDVCMGELNLVADPLIIGQKILSSVFRQGQNFGGEYTSLVLKGSKDERIIRNGHDQLSTYGLLADHPQTTIRQWIEQCVAQGFLDRVGEYGLLEVTPRGRQLLKGEVAPMLLRPIEKDTRKKSRDAKVVASWEGVDRDLFDDLRLLRHDLAIEASVPAYVVFTDETLRELSSIRPSSLNSMRQIRGVGEKRLADYGDEFVKAIVDYGERTKVPLDQWPNGRVPSAAPPLPERATLSEGRSSKPQAFGLFRDGKTIEQVMSITEKARSTVVGYLAEFIEVESILDHSPWLSDPDFDRIQKAVAQHGLDKLKPIFDSFNGEVPYEKIHIAAGCLKNRQLFNAGAGNSGN